MFKPNEVIKNLLSEKKFNYYYFGLFRTSILKKGYNFCPVRSGDRFILLQYAYSNQSFGYVSESTYFRGIHNVSAIKRYPTDTIEINIEKQKWILNFLETIKFNVVILKKQKIKKLKIKTKVIIINKIFLFLIKTQLILILRFLKHRVFRWKKPLKM